eukprot:m.151851 g.151851  ORF g.151851 m.151851 type:complete len:195 (-) comp14308_c0_seq5:534-1118(-)
MLRAPELEPGIAGLRARVKHRAALVQAMLKRTSNHEPETSAPQVQLNTQVQSCRMCSRLAPAGKKLLRCARCLAVLYCSSECQKRDWKSHKSFCKMATTQRNDLVNKGSNPAKFNDVLAWAQSVPDLMQHVMSLAWMNRKVQPIVQIKGGVIAVRSEKCLLWILHQQVTPVQSGGPPRTPLSTRRLEPPWVARR